jgi:hypothetical protein
MREIDVARVIRCGFAGFASGATVALLLLIAIPLLSLGASFQSVFGGFPLNTSWWVGAAMGGIAGAGACVTTALGRQPS